MDKRQGEELGVWTCHLTPPHSCQELVELGPRRTPRPGTLCTPPASLLHPLSLPGPPAGGLASDHWFTGFGLLSCQAQKEGATLQLWALGATTLEPQQQSTPRKGLVSQHHPRHQSAAHPCMHLSIYLSICPSVQSSQGSLRERSPKF